MKTLITLSFILMASFAFASGDINTSDSMSDNETVEVGDIKTSTCSAHVAMGEQSEVEAKSGSSSEDLKSNSSRQ